MTLSHSLTPSQLKLHDAVAFFYAIRDRCYVTLSHSLKLFRPTPHDAVTLFNTNTEFSNTHSPCNLNFLVVLQIKVNSQVNCEDEMLFNVKANGTHIYHCNGTLIRHCCFVTGVSFVSKRQTRIWLTQLPFVRVILSCHQQKLTGPTAIHATSSRSVPLQSVSCHCTIYA